MPAIKYRGWDIYPDTTGFGPAWHGYSPDYDASWEGPEDGWFTYGQQVEGATIDEVRAEIDALADEEDAQ